MCLSDFKTILVSALCGIKSTKYVVVILVHLFAHLLYNFFPLKFSCRLSRQICWILVFNWLSLLDIILDCFMYFFSCNFSNEFIGINLSRNYIFVLLVLWRSINSNFSNHLARGSSVGPLHHAGVARRVID